MTDSPRRSYGTSSHRHKAYPHRISVTYVGLGSPAATPPSLAHHSPRAPGAIECKTSTRPPSPRTREALVSLERAGSEGTIPKRNLLQNQKQRCCRSGRKSRSLRDTGGRRLRKKWLGRRRKARESSWATGWDTTQRRWQRPVMGLA